MDIITENGKDYLVTYVAKFNNSTIDAGALFNDLNDACSRILTASNMKNHTHYSNIYSGYGSPIQSMINRFCGNYFSPSFMKGYQANPALLLMQNFFTEQVNDATVIGTDFHKVMEDYYSLPGEERDRYKLWELEKQVLREGQDKELLDKYIQGYVEIKDYLHPRKPLDDKTLKCKTEHKGRANDLYVKSIGYSLPCAVAYVADRIDYRGDDIIILDYKTGKPTEESVTFDGYLGSMILYKWAMEQELNTTINKGYLIYPGGTKKYFELDYSRENEEKLAEQIDAFYKQFRSDYRSRKYEYTDKGYFTSDDAKKFREVMNDNTIWMSKIPVKIYIGEHKDSVL